MRRLGLGRYLLEWALLLMAGGVVGEVLGASADDVGRFRASVLCGLAVIGLVDPVVYVTVARGLVVDPNRFFVYWGLSVLGKFAWIAIMGLVVISTGAVTRQEFLLVMGGAFPIFTAHQVLRLVRVADREAASRRSQGAQ